MATDLFKTPEEFVNYYTSKIKEELQVFDIQANKVGFFGFLMSLLGYTNFDVKQYYDSLFKEAFIATAQEDDNLFLHSSTYGYVPSLSTPATGYGSFNLDFSFLPKKASSVVKREIFLNPTGGNIEFIFNDIDFITSSEYRFILEDNQYSGSIRRSDGRIAYLPSSTTNVSLPFVDVTQEKIEETEFTLPTYEYLSFYPHTFTVSDGFLSNLIVEVTESGATESEIYDVKYVKYFENSQSNVVFLRQISSTLFSLEFGNGIRGKWVPGASVTLTVSSTQGSAGNTGKADVGKIITPTQLRYVDTNSSGTVVDTSTLSTDKYITVSGTNSEGGTDPLSGSGLRTAIVDYISTRDNMVSELDFYSIATNYFSDVKFTFKKVGIIENMFYILRSFRDKYQSTIPSTNLTVNSFLPTTTSVDNLVLTPGSSGVLPDDDYYYVVYAYDEFGVAVPSSTESVTVSAGGTGSVSLTWDAAPLAEKYRVYGRSSTADRYWETTTNSFNDLGDEWLPGFLPYYSGSNTVDNFVGAVAATGTLSAGTYTYTILAYDDSDIAAIGDTIDVELDGSGTENAVDLSWTAYTGSISGTLTYRIYGRSSSGEDRYWVFDNVTLAFTDNGDEGYPGTTFTAADQAILNPEFTINETTFISPFLYKYDSIMRWYSGYIFYDNIIKYLENIEAETVTVGGDEIPVAIPNLFFNIIYNSDTQTTRIFLKSYENLDDWTFKISSTELSISDIDMSRYNETSFYYDYTTDNGIIFDTFSLEIAGSYNTDPYFTSNTEEINQSYDIIDVLKLPTYQYNSGSDLFIVGIPVLSSEVYFDDSEYYTDLLFDFVVGLNFKENRMISDNIQFRFLNTIEFQSSHLDNGILQERYLFDNDVTWLSDILDFQDSTPVSPEDGDRYVIGAGEYDIVDTINSSKMIRISTDVSSNFAADHIIRIINETTSGLNGLYTVVTSTYNAPNTEIVVSEDIIDTTGEGTLQYALDSNWREGGPNNVAEWDDTGGVWTYETVEENTGLKDYGENIVYVFDGEIWNKLKLTLPLKMNINIRTSSKLISLYNVDVIEQEKEIYLDIATKLQQEFSGIDISYYHGKIIDYVMDERKSWIKDVTVEVKDANDQILLEGLESVDEIEILKGMSGNKLEVLKYTPVYYHWDVDLLNITFTVD